MPGFVKTKEDARLWNKAKGIAAEEGHKEEWQYVTGIYKKMHGGKVASGTRVAYQYLLRQAGKEPKTNPGGRAEEKGVTEKDFPKDVLEKGIKVELEHGKNNRELALRISLDHLAEFPGYYDALEKMEKGLKI